LVQFCFEFFLSLRGSSPATPTAPKKPFTYLSSGCS
jgi:hypothetical protein